MSKEQNQKSIKRIMDIYKEDIDVDLFEDDFEQFSLFLKKSKDTRKIYQKPQIRKENVMYISKC